MRGRYGGGEEQDFIDTCRKLGIGMSESELAELYRQAKAGGLEFPMPLLKDWKARSGGLVLHSPLLRDILNDPVGSGLGRYGVSQYRLPTVSFTEVLVGAVFFLPRLIIDNGFRVTLLFWLGLGLLVDGFSRVSGLPRLQSSSRAQRAVLRSKETAEEKTKRLLQEGDYIGALGLEREPIPVSVRNKVIDLREARDADPGLSPLLLQAQDALIKDRPGYEKDCELRDGICHTLSRRYGEAVLDIYPKGRVWQLVRDKPLPASRLHTYVMEEVNGVVAGLPALKKPNGSGEVRAFVASKDCPDCKGSPLTCSACHGSGKKDRSLEGEELMREAREHPAMRRRLRHTLLWRLGVARGIGAASYLYFWFLFGSPGSWHEIARIKASVTGPCPTCLGSGKHCSCTRAIRFGIPSNARINSVIKGGAVSGGGPLDKPAYARLVK